MKNGDKPGAQGRAKENSIRQIGLEDSLIWDVEQNEKACGEPPEARYIHLVGPGTNGKACGRNDRICVCMMDVIWGEKRYTLLSY